MTAMKKEKGTEDLKGRAIALAGLVGYQDGAIVSREVVSQPAGTVTAFAFDEGEQLSEHTAPFDAMVIDLDGEADISIGGKANRVKPGEMIIMPAARAARPEGGDAVQDAPGHDQETGVNEGPQAGARARRPVILLTNDDGFYRETIQVLFRELGTLGRTYIVAPDREKSACSLAVTLRQPLRVQHIKPRVWAVEGTPVDCIYFALQKFLPRRPDLIVSGHEPRSEPRPAGHQLFRDGRRRHPGDLPRHPLDGGLAPPRRQGPLRPEIRCRDRQGDRRRHPRRTACRRRRPSTSTSRPPPIKGVKITRLGWKFYDPEIIEKTDPRNSSLLLDRDGNAAAGGRRGHRRHGRPRRLHHADAPPHRHDRPSRDALGKIAPDRPGPQNGGGV